jgi:PIN domain nuclease of toxin-antitoxin system
MRYLVDTHTFIWAIYDSKKLSDTARDIFNSQESTIYLSSATFWEIAIKHSIGKAILDDVTPDSLPRIAKEAGFEILTLTDELLSTSFKLDFGDGHRDPFDRLIIWQAIQSNLSLISKDSNFTHYRQQGLNLIW